MPICERCADAASGADQGPVLTCPVCGVGPIGLYPNGMVRFHKARLRDSGGRSPCEGVGLTPVEQTGHDFCDGCPCQHRQPGSWKGNRS